MPVTATGVTAVNSISGEEFAEAERFVRSSIAPNETIPFPHGNVARRLARRSTHAVAPLHTHQDASVGAD
jgi:hypothetical protein